MNLNFSFAVYVWHYIYVMLIFLILSDKLLNGCVLVYFTMEKLVKITVSMTMKEAIWKTFDVVIYRTE